ncbi:MAG: Crp/Fnr family transcriptional regulator [Rhodocyclaceae bacterium]|nr:MAG: Crp/Fnr family transcriptional regulator [Rhodocyclaceae bacterium]
MHLDKDERLIHQAPSRAIDIPQTLSHLPLFLELSAEQLGHIAAGTREKRLAKGEMLFQKGDPPRGFFVIVFGQVKLAFPSSQGNEKVVDILGPRQCFGEAVMFMDRPYPVFAESLSDTLLLHISKNAVFELLEHDPSFARRMLAGLSLRLHALVQDVESYSSRSSTQRVIGFLLQHCEAGVDCEGEKTIALPTSKQVIASRLNLTPETLSRIFHDLAEAKLIAVHGKEITIHDMTRLREFDL